MNKLGNLPQIIKNLKIISAAKEKEKKSQKHKEIIERKKEGFDKYLEKNKKPNKRHDEYNLFLI